MRTKLSPRAQGLLYAALLVMVVPFVFPTWWMVTSSFKPINEVLASTPTLWPTSPTLEPYRDVFELQPFARQYVNSLYVAVLATLGTLVVSSLAGYGFARIPFRGRNSLFVFVLLGLLVPSEATIVPLFQMFNSVGLVNTHWPLVLIPMLGPPSVLATFIMRQFFITLPSELEEAARIDGLGWFQTYLRVALPLSRPALATVGIFTFLHSWNLYLEPLVFLSDKDRFTLPLALTQFVDAYGAPMWNTQLAAASLSTLPVLVVFVIAQKQFVEGLAHTGMK